MTTQDFRMPIKILKEFYPGKLTVATKYLIIQTATFKWQMPPPPPPPTHTFYTGGGDIKCRFQRVCLSMKATTKKTLEIPPPSF